MPPGPFVHYCQADDCRAWGAFGFEVRGTVRWFCREHRQLGERMLQPRVRTAGAEKQGVLL